MKEPTITSVTKELEKAFERWEYIKSNGCSDPHWPDGCNMNLVRNHISYYKRQLRELCGCKLPDIYYKPTPIEVSENYMNPQGEHYKTRVKNWTMWNKQKITFDLPRQRQEDNEMALF